MKDGAPVEPRVFDVEQASVYVGVSVWTMRTMIANKVVPTVQPPSVRRRGEPLRRVLIDRADLDRLIDGWRTT